MIQRRAKAAGIETKIAPDDEALRPAAG